MKQFKEYIVEYEIHHDGHGNYYDDEGNKFHSKPRSSFARRHTITSHEPDHPHSVHINGKKWKTFGSHSHASNVAKKIKGATVHKEEVEPIDEMDKSQPSSSRGGEGLPLGKEAFPVKANKVKSDALKLLQKQYKKVNKNVKEETACPVCKKDPCECEDSHGFVKEARMSAAVKLQRAFQREQEKSAASRKRAHELLNPPKKEEPKAPVKEELSDPTRNAKQEKDIATGKKPMPKRKILGFKQKTC